VATVDRFPDTPAQQRSPDTLGPDVAAGNHVIIDYGKGRYGMFAHIKPGTVAVRKGQRVRANTVIGRVGSSGNSDAPHLHFHLTNRPSPLAADGLPYEYARFGLEGTVVDDEIAPLPARQSHARQLPLDKTIVRFP
jgi:murein DD-endopeptidase MepM/ murein hydrolase activator NlpD